MTIEIKSLAALKRAITVGTTLRVIVGTTLRVIDHWIPEFIGTSRIVTRLQNNGFYFRVPGNERWQNAWCPYPAAKQVSFPYPGRFRFQPDEHRFWELEFADADAVTGVELPP